MFSSLGSWSMSSFHTINYIQVSLFISYPNHCLNSYNLSSLVTDTLLMNFTLKNDI